jgi:hypothetical protein
MRAAAAEDRDLKKIGVSILERIFSFASLDGSNPVAYSYRLMVA